MDRRPSSAALAHELTAASARPDERRDGRVREAQLAKFGKVPVLETYRQMAIRQHKIKDWQQAIWWANRGLALYGEQPARAESVDDLRKRLTAYQTKLGGAVIPVPEAALRSAVEPSSHTVEVLMCEACGASFERAVVRGRKPKNCPDCR